MNTNMIREISRNGVSGYPVLIILPLLLLIPGWFAYQAIMAHNPLWAWPITPFGRSSH